MGKFKSGMGPALLAAVVVMMAAAGEVRAQNLRGEYYQDPGWTSAYYHRLDAGLNFTDFVGANFPDASDDDLSVRWLGSVIAPGSGASVSVRFSFRTDDGGRVWVDGRMVADQWRYQGTPADMSSPTVTLVPGRKYDIAIVMFEGGGGEGAILEWQVNGAAKVLVPAANLVPQVSTPQISLQSGAYTNAQVVSVRCPTAGAAITVSTGGAFAAYTGPFVVNAGVTIQARATRTGTPATGAQLTASDTETVTVTIADTTRPRMSMVQSHGGNLLRVVFSEPVAAASANTAGNYTLDNGATVSGAALQFDLKTVLLTTGAALTETTQYVLTVSNVLDRAAAANTILPASPKVFTHRAWRSTNLVDLYRFDEVSGASAADSSGNAAGGGAAALPAQTADNQGPYFIEDGKFLGGMRFDGENDFLTTAGNLNTVMGQPVTSMAVWLRTLTSGSASGNHYQSIGITGVEVGGADDIFWLWFQAAPAVAVPTQTLPLFYFRPGDTANLTSGTNISDWTWHHVVISRNGVNGAIRIDGDRSVVTAANLDGAAKTTAFNQIGKMMGSPFHAAYPGLLDELRIYDAELTAADAVSLANTIPPVQLSGPMAAVQNFSSANLQALHGADDGIPNGSTMTYAWSVVTGPVGGSTFGSPTAQNTTIAFTIPGQYRVRVVLSDTHCSTSDDLIIDVSYVSVTPVTGLVTTEGGGTATFQVTLGLAILAGETVTIPISSSDAGEGVPTLDGVTPITQVVFTGPQPAGASQIVIVLGVDDSVRDGDQLYQIITGLVTGPGGYAGANPSDVDCTNIDNDIPAVLLNAASPLTTTESGGTAQFQVSLQTQPQAGTTVDIAFTSTRLTEGTVAPPAIQFTPANWNLPQLVIVTGVDDTVIDLNQQYFITTTLTSTDADYAVINPPDPFCVNIDNEVIPDADDAWGCGALGIEAWGVLALLALLRRRKA